MSDRRDIERLREEYRVRDERVEESERYSLTNPSYVFMLRQREREILRLLERNGLRDLESQRILEMGCGKGGVLLDFVGYGASLQNLYGVDLLFDRLLAAKHELPTAQLANGDGQHLPFPSECFDLLLQFTAFSSILDPGIKARMAQEGLRVLKAGGAILWYDFWLNPTNPQTAGIRLKEIQCLFPGCEFSVRKITLAPPISRRLIPISKPLTIFLESLRLFNSHYLVLIKKYA